MTTVPSTNTIEEEGTNLAPSRRRPASSTLASLRALYLLTLRQHLHGKRWMILAVLFLLPGILAVVVRATAPLVPGSALEFFFVFLFVPQGLLPLVALLYASGLIQDEQEDQTLTYLLIRPIPKASLYVTKLLATLTTTILLTMLFTAIIYAAIYVGAKNVPANLPWRAAKTASIHALAVAAYCALFGLMSLLTQRMLILGILYAALVEGLLANLPFSIRLVTVIYYARIIAYRTLDFKIPFENGSKVDLAAKVWNFDVDLDPKLPEHPQLRTALMVLFMGILVCTALAAYLCTRKEFHVKTPEKN